MEGNFFEKFGKIEQPPEEVVPEEEKKEEEKKESPEGIYRNLTEREGSIKKKAFDSIFERLVEKTKTSRAFKALLAAAYLACNSLSTRLSAEALEIPTQKEPVVLSEKEERAEKNIEERIKLFNSEIELYKSLGYELKLREAITFYDEDSYDRDEIIERLLNEMPCLIGDPLIDLQWRHAIDKEVPLELSTNEGKIAFTPLLITTERLNNNRKMVTVYNWLKTEEPVLYEKILYGKADEKNIGGNC